MKFPQMLRRLRKEKKISQVALKQELAAYGLPVSVQLLSRWENGHSTPTITQLFALCEILGVDNPADYFSDFRIPELNQAGLRKVKEYREDLILTGRYSLEAEAKAEQEAAAKAQAKMEARAARAEAKAQAKLQLAKAPVRLRPLYLQAAAAGTGQFLDSGAYEMAALDENAPDQANFGIRITGDSMEPLYPDGCVVWVQKTESLEDGQIGIFYLDGDAYIKKFRRDGKGIHLVSLNPDYAPIDIRETSDFRVFGRVLAKREACE